MVACIGIGSGDGKGGEIQDIFMAKTEKTGELIEFSRKIYVIVSSLASLIP